MTSEMTYSEQQKINAAQWKEHTSTLPEDAKRAAPYIGKKGLPGPRAYDFCLPSTFAKFNLLPEARATALTLFRELGIPWHAGVAGGPSNHLLSSQVQCANALTAMCSDPARITRAFGQLLDIDEVLEIEEGRNLTFEYIGPVDFFGEAPNGQRVRGAHCTSVDAAFRYRTICGVTELALVEWKYTEFYSVRRPDPVRDTVRLGRYGSAVADPDGPVRGDLLGFEHLLDEPFYQLVRQQLLARELEKSAAEPASTVRVVHVLSPRNLEYQQSLARPEHRALGDTVGAVWRRLLRHSDRFLSLDSATFLDPEITSREYVLRYAPDVVYDTAGLLTAVGVGDAAGLEDVLGFDGDEIQLESSGVHLRTGATGTGLVYPFTLSELYALIDEIDSD